MSASTRRVVGRPARRGRASGRTGRRRGPGSAPHPRGAGVARRIPSPRRLPTARRRAATPRPRPRCARRRPRRAGRGRRAPGPGTAGAGIDAVGVDAASPTERADEPSVAARRVQDAPAGRPASASVTAVHPPRVGVVGPRRRRRRPTVAPPARRPCGGGRSPGRRARAGRD